MWRVEEGDCREIMQGLDASSVDAIVTDPPYGLAFMGKGWDKGVPGVEFWREALRVLKPGGHLLAFGGTRTYHRLAVAIEDAGFEIRDCLSWLYGSGFPKGCDLSKAIDARAGVTREVVGKHPKPCAVVGGTQSIGGGCPPTPDITAPSTPLAQKWQGWRTGLKPAWEPIIVAMRPIDGTYAENAERWGVGGYNVGRCRIATDDDTSRPPSMVAQTAPPFGQGAYMGGLGHDAGRYPANLLLDEAAAAMLDEQTAHLKTGGGYAAVPRLTSRRVTMNGTLGRDGLKISEPSKRNGNVSRFFYVAKASRSEREAGLDALEPGKSDDTREDGKPGGDGPHNRGTRRRRNIHPTVKPIALMRWLVRLVRGPDRGVVLDPFCGSGTTGVAAELEGMDFIGCEITPEYVEIARRRIEHHSQETGDEPEDDGQIALFKVDQ